MSALGDLFTTPHMVARLDQCFENFMLERAHKLAQSANNCPMLLWYSNDLTPATTYERRVIKKKMLP